MTRTRSPEAKARRKAKEKLRQKAKRRGQDVPLMLKTNVVRSGKVILEIEFRDHVEYRKTLVEFRAPYHFVMGQDEKGYVRRTYEPNLDYSFYLIKAIVGVSDVGEYLSSAVSIGYLTNTGKLFNPLKTVINPHGVCHGIQTLFWDPAAVTWADVDGLIPDVPGSVTVFW